MKYPIVLVICLFFFSTIVQGVVSERLSQRVLDGDLTFEIHFEEPNRPLVRQVIDVISNDLTRVATYFNYIPQEPTHIIFKDGARDANGLAKVFPRNVIEINPFPPVGEEYLSIDRDWLRSVLIHEFIHIVQMEMTRGFPDFLRWFIGSTAKFAGVIPSWFSEGVAVWGESFFTAEGRIRNQEMQLQLAMRLRNPNFCSSVSCLDDPGISPFQQYPYWVGGFFIDYLENKKEGTVRCLAQSNAGYLPFFLDYSFEKCTGESVTVLFKEFTKQYLKRFSSTLKDRKNRLLKDLALQLDDGQYVLWDKGYLVTPSYLFTVVGQLDGESILVSNWSGKRVKLIKLDFPIEQIHKDIFRKKHMVIRMLKNIAGNLSRINIFLDIDSFKQTLIEKTDAIYFFPAKTKDIRLKYEQLQWQVFSNEKQVYRFPKGFDILTPRLVELDGKEYLFFMNFKDNYTYYLFSLSSYKTYMLFQTNRNYSFATRCRDDLLFIAGEDLLMFKESNGTLLKAKYRKLLGIDFSKNRIFTRFMELEYHLRTQQRDCSKWLGESITWKAVRSKETFIEVDMRESENIIDVEVDSPSTRSIEESYPSLRHFTPNYLFLMYNNNGNLSAYGASTSLNDPIERHNVDLNIEYYPSISKMGHDLGYGYKWDKNLLSLDSVKSYSYSSYKQRANSNEQQTASYSRSTPMGPYGLQAQLSAGIYDKSDFVSDREGHRFTLWQFLNYSSANSEAFFNSWKLQLGLLTQKSSRYEEFPGLKIGLDNGYKISRNLMTTISLRYSKYFKDTLYDGVITGGGASDYFSGTTFHEFYGMYPGDIFGNKMFTGRLQMKTTFARPHHGFDSFPFLPILMKRWDLLYGAEYAWSHWLYAGKGLYRDDYLLSAHLGLRLNANLFYYLSSRIDLTFANNFGKGDDKTVLFLLHVDSDFLP